MTELSPRQWQLLQAIREGKYPGQIAAEWGCSQQRVANVRDQLVKKGVIARRGDLPASVHYAEEYPWVPQDDLDLRYQVALPPTARLRLEYPRDSKRDVTVAPVRVARWDEGGWVIQGVPALNSDGTSGWLRVPGRWPVWCVWNNEREHLFPAAVGGWWRETDTVRSFRDWPGPDGPLEFDLDEDQQLIHDLTLLIGAVVLSRPVLDFTLGETELCEETTREGSDGS